MTSELLGLRGLEVGYRGRSLFPAASLSIRRGELWALIGPNGAGKTTLMRTILGLLPAISGEVALGEGVRVGYVPQRSTLDPGVPARVVDVVRGGLEQGWSFLNPLFRAGRREAVERAMSETDTARFARRQIRELSEGQRQRVLMARALVCGPSLLVLDEPTSAMDVNAEAQVFDLVDDLRLSRDLGVFVVSHHLTVLGSRATHAVMVDSGVLEVGTMSEVAGREACRARYGRTLEEAVLRGGQGLG